MAQRDGSRGSPDPTTPVAGADQLRIRRPIGGTDRKIVIVDDDAVNVLLLSRLLDRAGYTGVEAHTDPVVATERMLVDPPELLLLDLRMPGLDGYDVLARLAPLLGPPHELAVLVLTADLTEATRHRALAAGVRDFLTKPFDLVELSLRVANLLETSDLHRRLREQNEQLERAIAERTADLTQLAADLAHEVRTPLYAIRGIAEVLLDFEDELPVALRGDIEQIDTIALLALELVDVEIGAARTAAGRPVMQIGEVDVDDILDDVLRMMARLTRPGGASLEVGSGDGLPTIVTDATRVGQILRNLVANALAVTTDGVVRVGATVVPGDGHIAFTVRDSGPGVPESDRERIFERFERGDGRGIGGGVGLPIARRLARELGGDVTVTSSPEDGTCFTATIARDANAVVA